MPTKRTRVPRNMRARVTAEAVEAYRAGDHMALHHALKLKPWETSPLDVNDQGTPYTLGTAAAQSWPQALELREELERAD